MNKYLISTIILSALLVSTTYAASINGQQIKSQEQLQINQDINENGSQVRTQEQLQINQENQNQEQVSNQVQSNSNNQQRRSAVANAVQEMLQVAERNTGIGEQIRVIAQNQNRNQEDIEESLARVQKRSAIAKIIMGPNYSEINKAQELLNQNRSQIQQMEEIRNQVVSEEDKQVLNEQIQLISNANEEIEDLLDDSKKGFSLLGWMFKIFNR